MKKFTKYLLTIILVTTILLPIGYFLIFPNYNTVIGGVQRISVDRYAYELYFSFLTNLTPTHDQVLGVNQVLAEEGSIEEYLGTVDSIDPILENLDTKLLIDSINVKGDIFQGRDSNTMDKGFWHFPTSVYPGQRGNSVIIGHRYLKMPPARDTFFNLDKVKRGDTISILQDGANYNYIVSEIRIVESNDISVIQDSDEYQLTLITCTPLWSSEKRLVVIGKLDKLYQKT